MTLATIWRNNFQGGENTRGRKTIRTQNVD